MIKGAIFDADGTILDSMPVWKELDRKYLLSHGIDYNGFLSEKFASMSLNESSIFIKEYFNLTDSTEKIVSDILSMIDYEYSNEIPLKDGVFGFLTELNKRDLPMIVATSGNKNLLLKTFRRLKIDGFFTDILSCDELNTSKNEPYIYLKAAEKIKTAVCETAVFEDALYGLISAKKAGFYCVAVGDSSNLNLKNELIQNSDLFLNTFKESERLPLIAD